MRYAVQAMLPDEFLWRQGVYVQTCAQIEHLLWRILLRLEDQGDRSQQTIDKAFKARKVNRELFSRLRNTVDTIHDTHAEALLMGILDQIDDQIMNRHMAVHGAWFKTDNDTFHCEYTWDETPKGPQRTWVQYSQPFTIEEIDETLLIANELMGRVLELNNHLSDDEGT